MDARCQSIAQAFGTPVLILMIILPGVSGSVACMALPEATLDAKIRHNRSVKSANLKSSEQEMLGWKPKVSKAEGVTKLYEWMKGI